MRKAERLGRLSIETAFGVLSEVNALRAEGKDIISFAIGEPDFDTPDHIKEAGIKAIREGETGYSVPAGIPELRKAIVQYVARTRNIDVSPEEVVVTPGAKKIIFNSILACVEEGDEVIYPNPGFPIYESMINFVGAKAIPLPLIEELDFGFDIDYLRSLITPHTKMIILNSPHNPTGAVLRDHELEAIAEIALENDLWILSDEIYWRMTYEGNYLSIISIPDMKERTILMDGFSKIYAMTGWRLGFGVMNKDLSQDMEVLVVNSDSCTATFVQHAGVEALEGPQDPSEAMVEEFKARRDMIVQGLNEIDGFKCKVPAGAFYVYPNVTGACRKRGLENSRELGRYLLDEAGVAVLPRTAFGKKNEGENQEYLRFSYATSKENITEGLRRIREAV